MAKPCRVVVSPQLAEVLNLEPNQDLSYREWVQILHDGGLDKLADRALVALGEVKKGAKEAVELQNELEVREQRSINEPRDAKDVAIIFRKLFNFSPFEAVAAARIFDAKAARMSKLLGISKEDYYKRYWFTSEQEGGLSQIIGEQGAARVENALPNLEKAKSMYGKEPNWKIKRDTGWEKGIDGKWRFEISPVSLRSDFIIDENSVWNHVNEADGNQVVFNLNEVADMSILEQLYPSLKNAEFVFTKMKSGDRGAIIKTKDGKTIVYVNANEFIKDGTLDRDELRKTIVHEVQHGIQDIERFAQGTNLSAANKQVQNEIKEINDLLESGNINFYEKLKLLYKKRKLSKESKFGRYLRTAGEVEARNVVKRISFSDISRAVNTLKETEDIKRKNQIVITEDSLKSNSKLFQTDRKGAWSIDNFKIDNIAKSEQIPMDDYTAIVEKAINDAGYYTKISLSRTDFGDSNYIYAYLSEEDYMKGGEGIKFRISDHSVTNVNRLFNEVHLPFRIDKKNIESVAKNAVKEIEFKFAREKYFTSQDVFEDEKTTFEVNEKGLQPTDKIISERLKKGTEDKKVFLIERTKKVPYTIWKDKRDGKEFAKFRRSYTESELAQAEGDRKGAWSKEAAKAKRIISMYQKADSTTQAHEVVGHDFLDEIIQLSSTNEEMAEDLNTIVDEFIKETGSKVSKEKLLKDLKDFDVEKKQNQNGKDIHEWFAESAERYFATERGAREGAGFSKKMVALFEKFRQYMADLYSKMNKELVEPSPAMKQIFRKIFGAENFAEAEEMRKATFDRMNSLQASELEMNYSKSKPKLSDIINKYKPKEGLGQLSDDFVQDMYNAASIIVKDGEATRWNVTNKLQELMPHLKSEIEQLRKVLQEVGTKGNLRGGVENLLANPYITDEIKEKIAKLSEYTPESMAKVGLNAEQILSYYIGEADNNDIVGMQTVAKLLAEGKFNGFTEKVSLRQLLIANYNQLAKITKDENKRIDYVNAAVDQAEAYAIEGTGMGRMINMYKALGSLTADGLIVWAKRQEMKFTKPSFERFKSEIKDLKKRLKKAQEDIDYFFEQVVGREETEAQYKEVIAAYQAEIDALKSRKPKEPKASKSAYRNVKNKAISITDDAYKSAINALKSSKLFQDLSNLTPAQTVAYYLMERKPMNISQFAKEFSKALDKKVDPSELRELYQQTRDMLILKDIGYAEGLSANEELEKDLQDLEDTKRAKIEGLERKKAAAEAELAAMKTQMSEKDKEVKAKEALKRREKEIRDKFLDSLSQDGLWQQYVKSAASRVLGNLGSKLGAKQSEKALLDEFTQLATRELNKAIDELMPKQKGGKGATPNYAQQLGDLIANQEKLADIFDKAVKDFAEKNEGNANAQSILSKLNGLKNPFSEKLMENALEKEAQNYAIKISDLAYNYAGLRGVLKDQIVAQIVAETGLKGQQAAQLEQDLKNKFDSIIAEAKSSTADKLSNFVLSDLKRAMSGTLPKQKTYVEELLSALTQKAKEVALKGEKGTQKQAPITPIKAIKKALEAIQNGKPDASIWNDAVEQVKQKIEQDPDLSQQDKEDLNLYLNDYTSFVYDNMLNDSVILKAIKENLIANGYGSGNTVNFKALIVADGQAQMQERQRLIEKLKQDLSQYDPVQVDKVLDAIAERYQRLINEKRKQIADEYINQTFKTKSPSTRRAIRGTIGKLIIENRMGLFDDTNNAILDALAEKKGFTNMTSDDWAKIKEYADLVEALPLDSNLQNEALEEMTAFVRIKMPGRWLLIATAVRYGVLLGRITSNIKNAVGGFEQALTLTLARAMRGDTEFGKSALKGFGQGDFKDVLIGGGINQANRISVEADANGMPRFRVLEYLKPKTIGGKVVESVKYSGRMLDAMDAIWQKFFTSGYDVKYMRKLLELENPNATKQEIDDMVSKIFSNDRIADYMDQATKEVIASGKKVTEAKVRRRAYEIMRDSLVRPIAKQLADFESTEKTYKTDFAENKGVGTLTGAVALYIANSSKKIVEPIVEKIMEVRGDTKELAEEKAKIYSSIIPNFILPFSKGLSGFIEKGLERELIYGLTKSIAVSIAAKSKTPTTIEEKMAQYRAIEKAKDIATSAVVTNLILYGVGGILYAMSKQWEDDEEKEGRYHPRAGAYGKAKPMTIKGATVKEKAEPENVIVLFGEEIPLSYVGGLGVAAMVDANLYKAFTEETDERKKTKAMEVASNFGTATLYTMDSFLSQAWLMQASDNKSITEMIQEGNTERALNLIQNTMINYMGSYIPWSGFINQSLQGARELSGGETYQEAKTISEKIQKQFGLAGITYTNTKKNYLGEDIKYSDVNKEGIIGLVNMFKTKSISAEDNWLRNIGFKEKASGQYAKGLKDLDGYSPSIEEYDRYDDRTKSMFGIIAKEAYNQKANIVPLPNEINRVTKKPYTVDEFQSKVMRSALSAVSKYNIVRLKKERGDYNSDKDAYEQDMENAFYNLDEVADIIYYKKGDEYKNRKRKKDALIDKVTEIK